MSDDEKVVSFPTSAEERRARLKAMQAREQQRLINIFIDEGGGDRALFCTPDKVAYADFIVAGHRETWPVRSIEFRFAYMRHLRRQLDLALADDPMQVLAANASMSKAAIRAAIDDFAGRDWHQGDLRNALRRAQAVSDRACLMTVVTIDSCAQLGLSDR
jgi:hypothetical protein